jgi:hypothetical protein
LDNLNQNLSKNIDNLNQNFQNKNLGNNDNNRNNNRPIVIGIPHFSSNNGGNSKFKAKNAAKYAKQFEFSESDNDDFGEIKKKNLNFNFEKNVENKKIVEKNNFNKNNNFDLKLFGNKGTSSKSILTHTNNLLTRVNNIIDDNRTNFGQQNPQNVQNYEKKEIFDAKNSLKNSNTQKRKITSDLDDYFDSIGKSDEYSNDIAYLPPISSLNALDMSFIPNNDLMNDEIFTKPENKIDNFAKNNENDQPKVDAFSQQLTQKSSHPSSPGSSRKKINNRRKTVNNNNNDMGDIIDHFDDFHEKIEKVEKTAKIDEDSEEEFIITTNTFNAKKKSKPNDSFYRISGSKGFIGSNNNVGANDLVKLSTNSYKTPTTTVTTVGKGPINSNDDDDNNNDDFFDIADHFDHFDEKNKQNEKNIIKTTPKKTNQSNPQTAPSAQLPIKSISLNNKNQFKSSSADDDLLDATPGPVDDYDDGFEPSFSFSTAPTLLSLAPNSNSPNTSGSGIGRVGLVPLKPKNSLIMFKGRPLGGQRILGKPFGGIFK